MLPLSLLLLPLLLSYGHGGYRATLNHIDTLLRTNPNTALAVIDSLSQYESNMSRAEQMRTRFYRGVARIRTYKPVTDDSRLATLIGAGKVRANGLTSLILLIIRKLISKQSIIVLCSLRRGIIEQNFGFHLRALTS